MIRRIYDIDNTELDELVNAGFIIRFEKALLIRHWAVNNQIRFDRFNPSECKERDQVRISQTGKASGVYYTIDETEKQPDLQTIPLGLFYQLRKKADREDEEDKSTQESDQDQSKHDNNTTIQDETTATRYQIFQNRYGNY